MGKGKSGGKKKKGREKKKKKKKEKKKGQTKVTFSLCIANFTSKESAKRALQTLKLRLGVSTENFTVCNSKKWTNKIMNMTFFDALYKMEHEFSQKNSTMSS